MQKSNSAKVRERSSWLVGADRAAGERGGEKSGAHSQIMGDGVK